MGTLSWNTSEGAIRYVVAAEASHGHRMEVTTNSTSTMITEFECGHMYFLKVKALGSVCQSGYSEASRLWTGTAAV